MGYYFKADFGTELLEFGAVILGKIVNLWVKWE